MLLRKLYGLGLACCMLAAATPASAQSVTVVVNGQVMRFDQPPVMRGNRVFVPMRAIFERLGSTVAYTNPDINAQGNGRSVHLAIGSTAASINGNPYTMDVAPFVVAGRTEVPLRFVAQSLGANVDWNGNTQTVSITTGASSASYTPQPQVNRSFYLKNLQPGSGAVVHTTHVNLHAGFSEAINRDTLHVSVDGRDVTPLVYANPSGFDVTPNWELTPGTHHVVVSGSTASGPAFDTGWSFTTSAGAAANFLTITAPSPGARVGSSFSLRGRTLAGSHVHVVASAEASTFGGLLQVGTGTYQADVTANANGYFNAPIAINAVSGGEVRVIVTTTSPDGASLERQIVYST